MNDELIPCTPELNRLKEFLADFKKPWALRPFPKNYGGHYKEWWTWAGGRITPKY